MKDNIAIAFVMIGCVIGLVVTLSLRPPERVKAPTDAYHLHEEMPYLMIGREWSETVCVTKGQLVRNGKHVPVPENLDAIVRNHLKSKIEFPKPEI